MGGLGGVNNDISSLVNTVIDREGGNEGEQEMTNRKLIAGQLIQAVSV